MYRETAPPCQFSSVLRMNGERNPNTFVAFTRSLGPPPSVPGSDAQRMTCTMPEMGSTGAWGGEHGRALAVRFVR